MVHVEVGQQDVQPLDRRVMAAQPTDAGPGIEREDGAIGAHDLDRGGIAPVAAAGPELASDPRVPHSRTIIGSAAPRTWRGHRGADRASPPAGERSPRANEERRRGPRSAAVRVPAYVGEWRRQEDGCPGRLVDDPWCVMQGRRPFCKRHLTHVLEMEAEQGFGSFVDKDQVARCVDHKGRDRQAMGQLADQDQFNGQLGHDYTPRRSKTSTEWLIDGLRGKRTPRTSRLML